MSNPKADKLKQTNHDYHEDLHEILMDEDFGANDVGSVELKAEIGVHARVLFRKMDIINKLVEQGYEEE